MVLKSLISSLDPSLLVEVKKYARRMKRADTIIINYYIIEVLAIAAINSNSSSS